jgi:hypothetical protein
VYLVRFHCTALDTAPAAASKPNAAPAKKQLARLFKQLPEAVAVPAGAHLSLEVRGKRFGYLLDDHHGDGRVALHCKASPEMREALRELAPEQLHIPKYVGKHGWIGLWLDRPASDWSAFDLAVREAYVLVAPKRSPPSAARGRAPRRRKPTRTPLGA